MPSFGSSGIGHARNIGAGPRPASVDQFGCAAMAGGATMKATPISRGLAMDCSARMIAVSLGRSPSTISREIARNGSRNAYRAAAADQLAYQRARRPKAAAAPIPTQER
ncbi:helix-turn-helix domain-containing protein [Nocardia testacea]|uniref:helix-turn-helix domain-containing protein n=1 Tax=Nocardia testacea TaxID=248551 RepID=UPI003C2D00BD